MSFIYAERTSKRQFIKCIQNKTNIESELVFVKKYHKYKPFFNFLPIVLTDIIMSYTNDIFVIKYELFSKNNNIYGIVRLPYLQKYYNIEFTFIHSSIIRFEDFIITSVPSSQKSLTCHSIQSIHNDYQYVLFSSFNTFMQKYYGYTDYFLHVGYSPFTINKSCNYKLLKQELIIVYKIINYLKKIDKTKTY